MLPRGASTLSSARSLLARSPIASCSALRPPKLARAAHNHSVEHLPKRPVGIDTQPASLPPLSINAYLPTPPYTPLFPIYTPLFSISPLTAAASAEVVLPLPRDIFDVPLRKDILHACVVHHLTLLKKTTVIAKIRSEVRGSGKKVHQQKGSGRARAGDSSSPIRTTGGKTFGPRHRDWSTEMPRKVRQLGFKVALSQKLREGRLRIVDEKGLVMDDWYESLDGENVWAAGSLPLMQKRFKDLGFVKPTLVLYSPWAPPPSDLLPNALPPTITLASISSVATYEVLRAHDVILDKSAVEWVIDKTREVEQTRRDRVFDGNAMVMRRRKLGLTDFPAEGEVDESKAMLAELEARLAEYEGGKGPQTMDGLLAQLKRAEREKREREQSTVPVFGAPVSGVEPASKVVEEMDEDEEVLIAREVAKRKGLQLGGMASSAFVDHVLLSKDETLDVEREAVIFLDKRL